MNIIHEDNHLLAVNKPSGLPSQPDESGDPSLDALAKDYIRVKYAKPGDVYMALLHRLDRPTSGVVLLARTGKAAARMADLFRRREIAKTYLAVVDSHPGATLLTDAGNLLHHLEPGHAGGMKTVREPTGRSREARLSWAVLDRSADGRRALLEVALHTGVKHQIRCQFAAIGWPVAGDFRYGPLGGPAHPEPVMGGRAILLHAWRASFLHPVKKETTTITAPLPAHWDGPLKQFAKRPV